MTVRAQDATTRLDALAEFGTLLWNRPATVGRRDTGSGGRAAELVVVPSGSHPRLAVPAGEPRAAAGAVLAHGRARTPPARLGRWLLAGVLRTGAGPRLFRTGLHLGPATDPSILDHVSDLLGQRVMTSIALTPARANRKPVLHLLDPRGRSVAFVKIGINDLTRDLVRHETAVLRHLAVVGLRIVRPPDVLHAGTWDGVELLVLAPLPNRGASEPEPALLAAAMRELAEVAPPVGGAQDGSGYVRALIERAGAASDRLETDDRGALGELAEHLTLLEADPDTSALRLGTWHGDWTAWNCGQRAGRMLLWDWERCRHVVPRGFDALHYAVQFAVVHDRRSHRQAAQWCLDTAPEVLEPWGIGARPARLVAALYLAEIGLRYLMDGQRAAGGPGGDVRTWVLPALRSARSMATPREVGR